MAGKVLIVDDEPSNVAALRAYFYSAGQDHDYAESIEDAAILIAEAQKAGKPYDLVICDNHFYDDSLADYDPNFNGLDLVMLLAGMDERQGLQRFAEDYFGECFDDVQAHYATRLMMFSGSAEGSTLDDRIPLVPKFPDEEGVCCELGVVEAMQGLGFSFDEDPDSIRDYKSNNSSDYN